MPATHTIETVSYDPGSFDDFIKALRAIGLTVKQKQTTIDGVAYTHYATLDTMPFNDGIYFKYTPESTEIIDNQEVYHNSFINYRIAKGQDYVDGGGHTYTLCYLGAHGETQEFVYKIPYIRTSYGGLIIRGIGYYEVTQNGVTRPTYDDNGIVCFLPPIDNNDRYEFIYSVNEPAGYNDSYVDEMYLGDTKISHFFKRRDSMGSQYIADSKNILVPIITARNDSVLYTLSSQKVYEFKFRGQSVLYSMGTIFKDQLNNEYYDIPCYYSQGLRGTHLAIKL